MVEMISAVEKIAFGSVPNGTTKQKHRTWFVEAFQTIQGEAKIHYR